MNQYNEEKDAYYDKQITTKEEISEEVDNENSQNFKSDEFEKEFPNLCIEKMGKDSD